MQYKRPLNLPKSRKTGVPTYVNSFQFLRANELVLSVKLDELVDGVEIPPEVMARCKGEPLTDQELADWRAWKARHDSEEKHDAELAVMRQAGDGVESAISNACNGMDRGVVTYTQDEAERLFKLTEKFRKRLLDLGLQPPKRGRGRPRIEVDDQTTLVWLPNFHPPGTPEHARYDEAMRRAGKKPGDPV